LKEKYDVKRKYKLFNKDVRELSKYIKKIEGVATEPYLGPFLRKKPTHEQAKKIMEELNGVYSVLLKELRKIVNGKIAIIVPRFRTFDNKIVKMDFSGMVDRNGFKVVEFKGVKMPIVYLHKFLEREIWILEK